MHRLILFAACAGVFFVGCDSKAPSTENKPSQPPRMLKPDQPGGKAISSKP